MKTTPVKILFQRIVLLLFCGVLLAVAVSSGKQVYTLSHERAEMKKDYGVLNSITYGLLSVNAWRDHLIKVVTHRIDDFEFTKDQEKALKFEISNVLHAVINKADSMLDKKQKTIGGKRCNRPALVTQSSSTRWIPSACARCPRSSALWIGGWSTTSTSAA